MAAVAWGAVVVGGDLLGPASVPIAKVAAIALAVVALVAARHERARPPAALAAFAVMAGICGLSLLWTVDREATLRVCRHLAQEGGLLLAVAVVPDRARLLRALAWGAMAGAVVLTGGLLWEWAAGEPEHRRLVVGLGDSNHQARQLVLAAVLGLAMLRTRPGLVFALLIGIGVGLTGSRGAWLAWLAAAGVAAVRPPGPSVRRQLAACLVGVIAGALLLSARGDVRSPLPHGDREELSSGRDAIWLNTLGIVADHPLLGVGAGAAPARYDIYRAERVARGGLTSKPARDPHNHYLQLLAETGPVGLLAFLVGLGLVVRDLRRTGRWHAAAVLAVVAVGAITLGTLEQKAFWLGLVWAALAATRPAPPAP